MWTGAYYLLVIIVAVWAILTGYRKGFLRQLNGLTGVAFGIVAARLMAPDFTVVVDGWMPEGFRGFNRTFLCDTLAAGIIYIIVASLVTLATVPVGRLVSSLGDGVLNSIGGAIFRCFQFLMVLSIVYNLLVDLNPRSELTRSSRLHDGNIVEGVMQIAPSILGFPGAEEVDYRQQLEDAKKIS